MRASPLQYTYKRHDPKTGTGRAGAARHAAARPRPDRPGGGRRVRAEQFPQADRRGPGQRLGQPASQRADLRSDLRAALAHRPHGGVRRSQARVRFHPAHRPARWATSRSMPMSAARRASARTCATISARRVRGRRCPARRPSSARQLRLVPVRRHRRPGGGRETSFSTAIPTATACGSRIGRSSPRPRRACRSPIAACASPTRRCCARRNSIEQNRFTQFGSINVTFRY